MKLSVIGDLLLKSILDGNDDSEAIVDIDHTNIKKPSIMIYPPAKQLMVL